jgi:hypothetical protein
MTMIIPQTPPPERVKDLLARGTLVERDALEALAEKGFDAAIDALAVVKKYDDTHMRALVVMDPDEDALVVLWKDAE